MVTRYVNTDSTAGGNGTTNATTGSNRAFATITGAETALENSNYADDLEILCCGSTDDTSNLNFSATGNYVTSGHTIYVKANRTVADGFNGGFWNDNTYILSPTSGTVIDVYTTNANFVFDGIQIYLRSGSFVNCILLHGSGSNSFTMKNCLFKCSTSTTYDAYFTSWYYTGTGSAIFENCIFVGYSKVRYALHFYKNITHKAYNCVINGCQYGIHRTSGTSIAKNCSVFNNDDDFYGTITIDHCASDDGDGTNPIAVSNWANQFVNLNYLTNVDFRLKRGCTLIKAGIGPVLDSAVPVENMRSAYRSGSVCDVGPFEYGNFKQSAGGSGINLR
jgi:hypothetical protein